MGAGGGGGDVLPYELIPESLKTALFCHTHEVTNEHRVDNPCEQPATAAVAVASSRSSSNTAVDTQHCWQQHAVHMHAAGAHRSICTA